MTNQSSQIVPTTHHGGDGFEFDEGRHQNVCTTTSQEARNASTHHGNSKLSQAFYSTKTYGAGLFHSLFPTTTKLSRILCVVSNRVSGHTHKQQQQQHNGGRLYDEVDDEEGEEEERKERPLPGSGEEDGGKNSFLKTPNTWMVEGHEDEQTGGKEREMGQVIAGKKIYHELLQAITDVLEPLEVVAVTILDWNGKSLIQKIQSPVEGISDFTLSMGELMRDNPTSTIFLQTSRYAIFSIRAPVGETKRKTPRFLTAFIAMFHELLLAREPKLEDALSKALSEKYLGLKDRGME